MLSNLSQCSLRKNKTVIAIVSIYETSKDVVFLQAKAIEETNLHRGDNF
jgi:hypothetical protein